MQRVHCVDWGGGEEGVKQRASKAISSLDPLVNDLTVAVLQELEKFEMNVLCNKNTASFHFEERKVL